MRITIPMAPLRGLAKMANTVAQANTAVPSHGYVHLEAKTSNNNPRLVLQAFDGDLHWIGSDGGGVSTVDAPGVVVVRADQFHRLCGSLSGGEVELELQGAHLAVRAGRSRNRLAVLPPDQFPGMDLKLEKGTRRGAVGVPDLQRVLRSLGGFCGPDSKAIIHALRLANLGDGLVEAASTDGYRGALLQVPGDVGDVSVLLSSRQRQVLAGYLAGLGEEDELGMACDGKVMAFASPDGSSFLHCRMMAEGDKFPPVAAVFPKSHAATLELATGALKAAIARAMLVAKDDHTGNRMYLSATEEGLKVEASTQFGEADEEVEGAWDSTLEGEVAVNGAYLLDALANMPDRVRIRFSTPTTPIVVEGLVPKDEHPLRVVLMPIVNPNPNRPAGAKK